MVVTFIAMNGHELSISVHDLDAGGKDVDLVVRAAWMRGALEGSSAGPAGPDGALEARVSKSGPDVVVRGRLYAELTVPCARCLEPARVVIHEPLSALAVPAASLAEAGEGSEEEEAPSDQADVIPYDGETVLLDDLVRDELLLAIPMIPLCSDACPGIRPETPSAAAEVGIDPRFRALLDLKKPPVT